MTSFSHPPASLLCTFLILDRTNLQSRMVLDDFVRTTNIYTLKGCIIPLTSVEVHVIQVNSSVLDSVVISEAEIIEACIGLGFDSNNVNFHNFEIEDIPKAHSQPNNIHTYPLVFKEECYKELVEHIWAKLVMPRYLKLFANGDLFIPFLPLRTVQNQYYEDFHHHDTHGNPNSQSIYQIDHSNRWPVDSLVDLLVPNQTYRPGPFQWHNVVTPSIESIPLMTLFSTLLPRSGCQQKGHNSLTKFHFDTLTKFQFPQGLDDNSVTIIALRSALMNYTNHLRRYHYSLSHYEDEIDSIEIDPTQTPFPSPLSFLANPRPFPIDKTLADISLANGQTIPLRYLTSGDIAGYVKNSHLAYNPPPLSSPFPKFWGLGPDSDNISSENEQNSHFPPKLPKKLVLDAFIIVQQRVLVSDPIGLRSSTQPQWFSKHSLKTLAHHMQDPKPTASVPPHMVLTGPLGGFIPPSFLGSDSLKNFASTQSAKLTTSSLRKLVGTPLSKLFGPIRCDRQFEEKAQLMPPFVLYKMLNNSVDSIQTVHSTRSVPQSVLELDHNTSPVGSILPWDYDTDGIVFDSPNAKNSQNVLDKPLVVDSPAITPNANAANHTSSRQTPNSFIQPLNAIQTCVILPFEYSEHDEQNEGGVPNSTQTSSHQVKIELNYLHRSLEKLDDIFEPLSLSPWVLSKAAFGSVLPFLPKAYAFGTYIIPFHYSHQNSLPRLSHDAAVLYNSFAKGHNEVPSDRILTKKDHHNAHHHHPLFSQPPIPSILNSPELYNNTVSADFQQKYNHPTRYEHCFGPITDQVCVEKAPSPFNELVTQKNVFHSFFQLDCPIHFIVLCFNNLVDDDDDDDDKAGINRQEINVKGYEPERPRMPGPLMGQIAAKNPLTGQNKENDVNKVTQTTDLYRPNAAATPVVSEPITRSQYNYFKKNVPLLYKYEVFHKCISPMYAFYNFEKFHQNWHFHFVIEEDFDQYLLKLQNDAIQKQLKSYRNALHVR